MKNLSKATAQKIDKFVKIAQELHSGTTKYFSITCLTSIKSLCKEPEIAARFATYLAEKIQHKVNSEYSPQYIDPVDWASYKALINEVVPLLQAHVELPTAETLASLESLLPMLGANRQFTGKVYWGDH